MWVYFTCYTHIYTSIYTVLYIHIFGCVSVCVCVYMHVCIQICAYISTQEHIIHLPKEQFLDPKLHIHNIFYTLINVTRHLKSFLHDFIDGKFVRFAR